MAQLLSVATGNFTASGTWATVDATSLLNSESGTTAATTSLQYSSTFTPGAITVDALSVKFSSIAASPSGTITVGLYLNAGNVLVDSCTANISDLPLNGWMTFKLGASQLLLAATAYKVGVTTSSSSQATLYTDGTTANWTRFLRTTTTAAPGSGDNWLVNGELTGAGTGNSFTVTMENTATTTFGGGGTTIPTGNICKRGTLTVANAGSTNYYLKNSGHIKMWDGGTINNGSSGTRLDSTSTMTWDFSPTAAVGFLGVSGGAIYLYGASKTTCWTLMTADAAASDTVITVASTAGWAAGDVLCFTPTGTVSSQHEKKTISTVDSATQVTLTAGLTNAHSGTSPRQCAVGNITRNLKIIGTSGNRPRHTFSGTFIQEMDSIECEFTNGSNTYFVMGQTSGTVKLKNSSIHNFSSTVMSTSGNGATFNIDNNVIYLDGGGGASPMMTFSTGSLGYFRNTLMIGGGGVINLQSGGFECSGHHAATTGAYTIGGTATTGACILFNCVGHHGSSFQYTLRDSVGTMDAANIYGNVSWENQSGVSIQPAASTFVNPTTNFTIGSHTCFSNTSRDLQLDTQTSTNHFRIRLQDWVCNGNVGGAGTTSPRGILLNGNAVDVIFNNCSFGATVAYGTDNISLATANDVKQMVFNNCSFGTGTFISGSGSGTAMRFDSYLKFVNFNEDPDDQRAYFPYGLQTKDVVITNTAPQSVRLAPVSNTVPLQSDMIYIPITAGDALDISIAMRMSAAGDPSGANYNGSVNPSLVLLANPSVGIDADVTLDTMSVAVGNWETLTGTTAVATNDGVLTIVSRGQGTTGWWNMADLEVAVA